MSTFVTACHGFPSYTTTRHVEGFRHSQIQVEMQIRRICILEDIMQPLFNVQDVQEPDRDQFSICRKADNLKFRGLPTRFLLSSASATNAISF